MACSNPNARSIKRGSLHARPVKLTAKGAGWRCTFREWLEHYSGGRPTADEYREIMNQL